MRPACLPADGSMLDEVWSRLCYPPTEGRSSPSLFFLFLRSFIHSVTVLVQTMVIARKSSCKIHLESIYFLVCCMVVHPLVFGARARACVARDLLLRSRRPRRDARRRPQAIAACAAAAPALATPVMSIAQPRRGLREVSAAAAAAAASQMCAHLRQRRRASARRRRGGDGGRGRLARSDWQPRGG